MRIALAMFLAFAAPMAAAPGGGRVQWETDWTAALAEAAKKGRPILVYFTVPG